jgi:hypothetical protein
MSSPKPAITYHACGYPIPRIFADLDGKTRGIVEVLIECQICFAPIRVKVKQVQ